MYLTYTNHEIPERKRYPILGYAVLCTAQALRVPKEHINNPTKLRDLLASPDQSKAPGVDFGLTMDHNVYGHMDMSAYFKGPRGPPQLLGNDAKHFPISAATPLSLSADTHPSGVSVRVKLDSSSHSGKPFRTGELVDGSVHIYAPSFEAIPAAARLSLRVYFESRTLFWNLEVASPDSIVGQQLQKVRGTASKKMGRVMRHEIHRGIVPRSATTLSWSPSSQLVLDFQRQSTSSNTPLEATLPFSFVIPRRITVTEYNRMSNAPRDLCPIQRCPPPTFRDCRDGSVQWVVEAILAFQPGSSPVHDDAMLQQSSDTEVVSRLVFPLIPTPEDLGTLRNEPYFGDDPVAKLHGLRLLSQAEQELGKKATLTRMRGRGGNWDAYVRKLGYSSSKFISSEVYTTAGARISTSAPKIPLFAYLKVELTNAKPISSLFRSPKPQTMYLQRAVVSLYQVISTRGGKEIKPHVSEILLRQQEHRFEASASSSDGAGILLPSGENIDAVELDLTIGLQDDTEIHGPEGNRMATSAKHFTPSFRTPNIQHEFILAVSFWFSGDEFEGKAARIPIQFTPGDENELPTFEDAVNATEEQPPEFQA